MVVHIFGHSVIDPVLKLAEKYDLKIIEDAAEVHGAEYLSQEILKIKSGSNAVELAMFQLSAFANKLITTGEGGR